MRVADYVASFFVEKGVDNVYSLPGGGAMHLIDAFTKNEHINHISFFHEQGASIAAEAASRASSAGVGVCCVTTGPGATNAITAVAGAWIESSPLIVISGQVKTSDMLGDKKIRQSGVQEVQVTKLVEPITKFSAVVDRPGSIKRILDQAYLEATCGRKGPVWVDIPLDVQGALLPEMHEAMVALEPLKDDATSNKSVLDELCRNLVSASRPLFLWGNGVKVGRAEDKAAQLIEALGLPSVFTWNASDILAYDHACNFGRPGVVAQRHPNLIVQNADLLISVGCSLDNVITAYNPQHFAPRALKYAVDVDPEQLANLKVAPIEKINMSAEEFIDYLLSNKQVLSSKLDISDWKDKCVSLKARYQDDFPNIVDGNFGVSHKDAVLSLSEALEPGQLIATGSSGLAIEAFYMIFRNKVGQKYFLTSGLGAMGYGLPASIGISVENPGKTVILVESDGSLAMNMQELQTLRNLELPVCICLMNNNGYASIRNTQENYFNKRYFGTGPEANQKMPDWSLVAKTFDLHYREVTVEKDIRVCLREFSKSKRPTLIDVRLASGEKLLPKCAAIPQESGNIISMPLEDMSPLLDIEDLLDAMDGNVSQASIDARNIKN